MDEYDDPLLTYYDCKDGACTEIYDLKCNRTCDHKLFDFGAVNVVILQVTLGQEDGLWPNKAECSLSFGLTKVSIFPDEFLML